MREAGDRPPSNTSKPFDFVNGVKDEPENDITISPNPVEDELEISGVKGDVRVIDVLGREIQINSQLSILNSQLKIDVSGLAPGVYFVRIGARVEKFVKIN